MNFTAAHESCKSAVGDARLAYPDRHIEVDDRLSWLLGRLGRAFPDDRTFYVHLRRDDEATARSFVKRWGKGIIRAYAKGILTGPVKQRDPLEVCLDYCDTVNQNIESFLESRPHSMTFRLEDADAGYREFWSRVGAEGDLAAALVQWDTRHNAS